MEMKTFAYFFLYSIDLHFEFEDIFSIVLGDGFVWVSLCAMWSLRWILEF